MQIIFGNVIQKNNTHPSAFYLIGEIRDAGISGPSTNSSPGAGLRQGSPWNRCGYWSWSNNHTFNQELLTSIGVDAILASRTGCGPWRCLCLCKTSIESIFIMKWLSTFKVDEVTGVATGLRLDPANLTRSTLHCAWVNRQREKGKLLGK